MDKNSYYVKIIKYEDSEVVRQLGPISTEREAYKINRGANINLNHEEYYTLVVKGEQTDDEQRNARSSK